MKIYLCLIRTALLGLLCISTICFSETNEIHSTVEKKDTEATKHITPSKLNPDSTLASIQNLEKNNDLIKALTLSKSLYKDNPNHTLAQIAYGRTLVKNSQAKEAIAILQPLAKNTVHDWQPWFWLGSAQLLEGDLDNAAFSLDEALAREGNITSLWVQRAIVEQERGTPASALHLLQVADSLAPDDSDVMINYAYATELNGDMKKAIVMYKHFLQKTASLPKYGRLRSEIFYRLSEFEKAKKRAADIEKNLDKQSKT